MIYAVIAASLCLIDLAVKAAAREALPANGKEKRLTKHLSGRVLYNKGFALGRASDRPELVKGVSIAAVVLYLVQSLLQFREKGNTALKAATAVTLGGALGNMIERVKDGAVTDYAALRTGKKIDRIVFNFADVCILLGGAAAFAAVAAGALKKKL